MRGPRESKRKGSKKKAKRSAKRNSTPKKIKSGSKVGSIEEDVNIIKSSLINNSSTMDNVKNQTDVRKGEPKKENSNKKAEAESVLPKRSRRSVPSVNYNENNAFSDEDEDGEERSACENCCPESEPFCPYCNMVSHLSDPPVPMGTPNRAYLTVPTDILIIRPSNIVGMGVWTLKPLPKTMIMGPFEGALICKNRSKNPESYWKIRHDRIITIKDLSKSNWMRFVNTARDKEEQNLEAVQINGDLYYRTIRNISAKEELLVHFQEGILKSKDDIEDEKEEDYFKPRMSKAGPLFQCSFCCLGFSTQTLKERHQLRCSENKAAVELDGLFVCHYCNVTCTTEEYLAKHTRVCKARFSSISTSKEEMDTCKKDFKRFQCLQCDYATHMHQRYVRHIKVHLPTKPFSCKKCDFKTKWKAALKKHEIVRHAQGELYKCNKCSYATREKSIMKTHMLLHTNIKPYICEFCNKGFVEKRCYEAHTYKHSNKEKPYKCTACNFASAWRSSLIIHIREIHTNDKMFKCKSCDYSTSVCSSLKSHSYTHVKSGKPYKCSKCTYECNKLRFLKNHVQSKHPKNG